MVLQRSPSCSRSSSESITLARLTRPGINHRTRTSSPHGRLTRTSTSGTARSTPLCQVASSSPKLYSKDTLGKASPSNGILSQRANSFLVAKTRLSDFGICRGTSHGITSLLRLPAPSQITRRSSMTCSTIRCTARTSGDLCPTISPCA